MDVHGNGLIVLFFRRDLLNTLGVFIDSNLSWKPHIEYISKKTLTPLFKTLNITKLHDLVSYQIAIFMCRYKNRLLPIVFNNFFTEVSEVHRYNTRSATKQSYYLLKVRTNYCKINIRFQAPVIWSAINEQVKTGSLSKFK